MKLQVLKCPECHANIEMEEGRTFFFCQYCGCKIILDDENKTVTINKNVNINKNTTHVDKAKVIEAKAKEKEWKRSVLIISIIVMLFVGFFGYEKHLSNVEEKKLQGIVDEIMIDIEEENFDEAYIKAKSLHYTSGWSDEIESKWDETR